MAIAEKNSEHPLGEAIINYAKKKKIAIPDASHFNSLTGRGIEAKYKGNEIYLGNRVLMKEKKTIKEDIVYLRSIPGIGFITANLLLGRLGDPENLRNVREIAAFLGLVPTEDSSGDRVYRGRITHLGDPFVRSRLIECSWVAIRYDKELEQFYHRIKSRHHPRIAASKAIVAVARKLTQRVYRVLKDRRPYVVH